MENYYHPGFPTFWVNVLRAGLFPDAGNRSLGWWLGDEASHTLQGWQPPGTLWHSQPCESGEEPKVLDLVHFIKKEIIFLNSTFVLCCPLMFWNKIWNKNWVQNWNPNLFFEIMWPNKFRKSCNSSQALWTWCGARLGWGISPPSLEGRWSRGSYNPAPLSSHRETANDPQLAALLPPQDLSYGMSEAHKVLFLKEKVITVFKSSSRKCVWIL